MAKIIKVDNDAVFISMDDSSVIKVDSSSLDFYPQSGDIVDVHKYNNQIIVSKATVNVNSVFVAQSSNVFNGSYVVNKFVYALFAIFLGGLGVHKFYAGRIALGIVYLLFCWTFIPGIIAFVEGVLALTRTADANGNISV